MQPDRVLVERLYVPCKANAVHEKHGYENALFTQCIEELVLQRLTLVAHMFDLAPRSCE